jgi:archaeal flagellar protein FlaI
MQVPSREKTKKLIDTLQELYNLENSRSEKEINIWKNYIENKITKENLLKDLKKENLFLKSKEKNLNAINKLIEVKEIFNDVCKDIEYPRINKFVIKKRPIINLFKKSVKKPPIVKEKTPEIQPKIKQIKIPLEKDLKKIKKEKEPAKKKVKSRSILEILGIVKKKEEISQSKVETTDEIEKPIGPKFDLPKELKPENYQVLIPGFAYAFIRSKDGSREYVVAEPELSPKEEKILEDTKKDLINKISLLDVNEDKSLFNQINKLFEKKRYNLTQQQKSNIVYYIARQIKGLDKIEPLMHDPLIEDIEGDGIGIPVFIVHRKYGHIATNIIMHSEKELQDFVMKMAHLSKSHVSYASPLLDAILPDGSRINATLTSNVSTRGPTFTIRKFPQKPLTAIDLINSKTLNSIMVAYLWTIMEFKKTVIVIGPTAGGKTTLLNILSSFIPPGQRVVSIEDTREINLLMDNWIPQVTRPGFGPPDSHGQKYGEVTMEDLIKESFRQRPDYLVVGEVRGKEMSVMFQGMASGHSCLSTVHAKSVDDLVNRLITPPISLEPALLTSLDVVVVTGFSGTSETKRHIKEIDEIKGYNVRERKIEYNAVYSMYEKNKQKNENDLFTKELPITYRSEILKEISNEYGVKINDLLDAINKRKKFIENLLVTNTPKDYVEFKLALNKYKETEEIFKRERAEN